VAGGYIGKMLFIDLSQGRLWQEVPDEGMYRDFIGGYGIGARVIFDRQRPKIDPLGPEAYLGFVAGLLTGTPALFGCRYTVVGKSPLTGTWGDANSGGDFGPYLKFSGYDAVFVGGISDEPVYLLIEDGKARLMKADHLWGKDTWQTEVLLKEELGRYARLMSIGPSGEKRSLISCTINNRGRAAARSGLAAVMGAKRLKAVVVKGKGEVPLADKAGIEEARRRYLKALSGPVEIYRNFGTCGTTAMLTQIGDTPVKNWSGSVVDFPNVAALSDKSVIAQQKRKFGCWRCPVACGGEMKAGIGRYSYPDGVFKPEYETLAAFGTMCLNDNLESIIMVNDICNRYGLDTISAGSVIAFAIECYENGIITSRDTDGIELKWGNHEAIVAMTEKLAKREGFGDVLADGVRLAAEMIGKGAEEFAIHIHGQEVPMHDPKQFKHHAAGYLDSTPARHTQGTEAPPAPSSGLQLPAYDFNSYAGRGEAHKIGRCLMHYVNCSGMCQFGYMFMDASALPEFLSLATGWESSLNDLLNIGERIANIRQAFNIREGITVADFHVPKRVLGYPPLESGPIAGISVDIESARRDYLVAMDWDPETGKPLRKKLVELRLEDVADDLWPSRER
jgi:aldehyde:ferredoxin oxidoreductase